LPLEEGVQEEEKGNTALLYGLKLITFEISELEEDFEK